MSAEQIKDILLHQIEQADERLLRLLHAVVEAYTTTGEEQITDEEIMAIPPSPDWKPMTEEELKTRLTEGEAQIERGEYFTIEEVRKEG